MAAPAAPSPGSPAGSDRPGRSGRGWLRWLKVGSLIVLLPVLALLIGLLIAWIVHLIRGNPKPHPAVSGPIASAQPSAAAPTSAAPTKPPAVVVPSDWVVEDAPPAGLTYSHPAGWVRRTSTPEVLRFAPAAASSTAPGIEGVGAGIETNVDPAQAITDFATRVYGGQPSYIATPVTAVASTAAGAHPGERQGSVTYTRSGVSVRVVIHSFRSGTNTVLVLGRSANAEPARAAQLEAFVEASVKLS